MSKYDELKDTTKATKATKTMTAAEAEAKAKAKEKRSSVELYAEAGRIAKEAQELVERHESLLAKANEVMALAKKAEAEEKAKAEEEARARVEAAKAKAKAEAEAAACVAAGQYYVGPVFIPGYSDGKRTRIGSWCDGE